MEITNELREWTPQINGYRLLRPCDEKELAAIADRIDAEHERLMAEQYKSLTIDMEPMTDENMAEHGWVRGPIGGDYKPMAKGHAVVDSDGNVGVIVKTRYNEGSWVVLVGFGDGESCRRIWFLPRGLRHYTPPSVEDVLHDLICDHEEGIRDEGDLIAEYAAKLREMLAGGE